MMSQKQKIVVLLSGHGSNLQAIIDHLATHPLPAEISAVISDNPTAYGLERARMAHIPVAILNYRGYTNNLEFQQALLTTLQAQQPDLIILAGFMRILAPSVVAPFAGRMLNIHPSLLPRHPGLHTHERVIAAQETEHGATVHFVTSDLDAGPIIAQARLPVLPTDTPESLKERVHHLEHHLYPTMIEWFITGRLQLTEAGVTLDQRLLPAEGMSL
jgi:phosphoribosylglycinamide formyltransferase-1